jgi:hypothetical protein
MKLDPEADFQSFPNDLKDLPSQSEFGALATPRFPKCSREPSDKAESPKRSDGTQTSALEI